MKPAATSAFLIATLLLSSCTSGMSPEALAPIKPSQELTGSVQQTPAPIPAANVGSQNGNAGASAAPRRQEVLAWAGSTPSQPASSAVMPQTPMPLAATAEMDEMVAPDTPRPSPRPAALMETASLRPTAPMSAASRSRVYSRQFRDAKPINFGKVTPRHFAVHGVDVSRWQGEIDWPKLRTQGANFAYIKATDGGDHLDPMFKTNWRRAREAGIRHGAYHFFYWCRTAGEQADWFIRNVPREPDALPPVIDVEYNGESSCKMRLSRAKVLEKMQVFMDKLERHYGQRPVIYTAPDFYKDNLQGEFTSYPFWLRSVAAHPSVRYPGRKWLFWQYSGSGLSHGVTGKIDLNVFNGSEGQWHDWLSRKQAPGVVASR